MLYTEKIAVCPQIHTKHINTMQGKNVGFLNVKLSSTEFYTKIQSVPRSEHSPSLLCKPVS
jgi:hypothetical protein